MNDRFRRVYAWMTVSGMLDTLTSGVENIEWAKSDLRSIDRLYIAVSQKLRASQKESSDTSLQHNSENKELTLDEVKLRFTDIQDVQGDDEAAHAREDKLYHDFVKHVAEVGNSQLREMAVEILKTKDLGFRRWAS